MEVVKENRDFNRLCLNNFGKILVLVFHAQWHEYSIDYLQKFEQLIELSSPPGDELLFVSVDAEKVQEVSKQFEVNQVPCIVFTNSQKESLRKLENEVPALVLDQLETFLKKYRKDFSEKKQQMFQKIESLLKENEIIVFIKGTPDDPQCKFTRQFLEILKDLQIKFCFYDIIADSDMRNWLRYYDNWPTYPQMFIQGKLVGGLDKVKAQIQDGSLQKLIPDSAKIFDSKARFQKIISDNQVILFSEGLPEENQVCAQFVSLLKQNGIKFNILNTKIDSRLQNYLNDQFQDSTPLLFSSQKLVGNYQKCSEFANSNNLLQQIPGSEWRLNGEQKFKYLISNCPVIAFIEGTVKEPAGQESSQIIQILQSIQCQFDFFNVKAEPEVLNYINNLNSENQQKIPLLYINQKLVGGIEVVQKLHKDGDIKELIQIEK